MSWDVIRGALTRLAPARPEVLQLESTMPPRNFTEFVEMLRQACRIGCEVRLRATWSLDAHWMKAVCPEVVINGFLRGME
jgi:hypothetical protein